MNEQLGYADANFTVAREKLAGLRGFEPSYSA
jgi:hypothetical protein